MAYSDDSVFPTTLDSIAGFGEGAANIQTTLSAAIASNPATIPLTTAASWPTTGGFALIEEGTSWVVYKYSGVSGNSLSSPDEYAGTEGSFSTAATVKCIVSAGLINKLVDAVVKMQIKEGVDGSAVTTTTDYKLSASYRSSARVHRGTSAQAITTATWTKVQLNGESWDVLGDFDSTTNYRFTAPIAGKYQVNGAIEFAANGTGIRGIAIYVNGALSCTGNVSPISAAGDTTNVVVSNVLNLAATDYVELYGYQTSGGNLNIGANIAATYMSIHNLL